MAVSTLNRPAIESYVKLSLTMPEVLVELAVLN
jgi:hypothetical protein